MSQPNQTSNNSDFPALPPPQFTDTVTVETLLKSVSQGTQTDDFQVTYSPTSNSNKSYSPTLPSTSVSVETQTRTPASHDIDPAKTAPLITHSELVDAQHSDPRSLHIIEEVIAKCDPKTTFSLHNGLLLKRFKGKDFIYIPESF